MQVISNPSISVFTHVQRKERQALFNINQEFIMFHSFIFKIKPKMVKMDHDDSDWVETMHAELNEFERNKVWCLIPTAPDASVIGLK